MERLLRRLLSRAARSAVRAVARRTREDGSGRPSGTTGPTTYPGDFDGAPTMEYAPTPGDPTPSPGEIVWTWVPFEEDHRQGKDRPVLLIGRDGSWLLGLQLTSVDHDRDAEQEARAGRRWIDIGSGGWDRQGRPSEVRVNRVIRVDPDQVRRDGAVLEKQIFDAVTTAVRAVAEGRDYDDDPA